MAPWRAGAPRCGLSEIERQGPIAEGYGLGHQLGLATCMDHMAQLAAQSSLFLVNVQEMEISFPVPETGGKGGIGKTEHIAVVARETELVGMIGIAHEILFGERLHQKPGIRGAVRLVTRPATLFSDGLMDLGHLLADEIGMT